MSFRETVEAIQSAPERTHFRFDGDVLGISHASADIGSGKIHDLVICAATQSHIQTTLLLNAGYRPADEALGSPEKVEVSADRGFERCTSVEISESNFKEYEELARLIRQLVQASLKSPVELEDALEKDLQGLL